MNFQKGYRLTILADFAVSVRRGDGEALVWIGCWLCRLIFVCAEARLRVSQRSSSSAPLSWHATPMQAVDAEVIQGREISMHSLFNDANGLSLTIRPWRRLHRETKSQYLGIFMHVCSFSTVLQKQPCRHPVTGCLAHPFVYHDACVNLQRGRTIATQP